MSPKVNRRIFDPFFTIRRGQGSTGRGPRIVHNIVTNRWGPDQPGKHPPAGPKIRIIMPREAPLSAAQ